MLLVAVFAYIVFTLLVGVVASRWVKDARDFILAGRKLPLFLASTALFATWFGSETVLGASSEFVSHGLIGVVEDPFGAALCLLLVGLLIARPLHRLNILTFCDFYRDRFGPRTELLSSLCMVPSYFGWIAAQLVAIGIIFRVVADVPTEWGIALGTMVVVAYTYVGGLWAVSITDFLQTVVIVVGLLWLALDLVEAAGGLSQVVDRAPPGFFRFWPEATLESTLHYVAAWITIGLGSIPQQDIFQRVMAAKSERVAVQASYLASFMYLSIGLIPLLIGLCALQVYPEAMSAVTDAQLTLPVVVMNHTGMGLRILFFGALLSAIMSTTSGAVLAPASILAENIIRPRLRDQSDRRLLQILRGSVVFVGIASALMAAWQSNIYDLVAQSSALSLVSLFIPLMAGLYWKRATEAGALLSIGAGMVVWVGVEYVGSSTPPILYGLTASALGMVAGSGRRSE